VGVVFMQLRTIVFFDGQNLYHLAKDAFGSRGTGPVHYSYPAYNVECLANSLVMAKPARTLTQIRFYTGVPDARIDPFWHTFWTNKLRRLLNKGIYVYKGRLNASNQEKGVDVSIAIDLINLTYRNEYDLAILVSQDWDFGPAVNLAKVIAKGQNRTVGFESCFPYGVGSNSDRGIPGTTWIKIDQTMYDSCLDPTDYR
jgi:uncharacterized LabA/DUF88 family protein